jgi:hypothetical protein
MSGVRRAGVLLAPLCVAARGRRYETRRVTASWQNPDTMLGET